MAAARRRQCMTFSPSRSGDVMRIAIDVVKASEAGETERGALEEALTEGLLASFAALEPANASM
jgi:hypothetical protein